MSCAAFLANLGWVSVSSQLILPQSAFLLSSSHIFFLFLMCIRHSISTCLADCAPCLHGHSADWNPSTFLECRNFLSPIFSVLICINRALAALQSPLCILSVFFVGVGQTVCNFLPVFWLDHIFSHSSKVFRSNASLMVAFVLPKTCSSAVYVESNFFYFPSFFFTLFHPVASLAATFASSFLFLCCTGRYPVEVNWCILSF